MKNLLTKFFELFRGSTKDFPQKDDHDENEGDEGIDDEVTIHANTTFSFVNKTSNTNYDSGSCPK